MNDVAVIEVGREAFFLIIIIGGPIMMIGLAVGLVIALFQTLTSIQEMTLTFVPKILAIFAAILIFLPFMINEMVDFGRLMFDRIIALG
ncbi:MAG: flagellar biosynthesis protein FliQ [Rhodospirillales bacterium]|nr:flagellar biosynthesis protein FliQ [Rhodospirillales bacterium]MCW8861054.1 flagellar biosynthesis protein FliQ [Rhodospirillales bacterium]MCW8953058.1 flagellar biosynthesis protein FliQ [Rhodospirillales bacterium]MCW8970694.1 flagellar biosynthesis protein FliQ [Rhodospirillales bacterium]MCW9003477.1 flagellar biosynthesis protein FliQ [Rhodospirillales bacterium]